MYDPATGRFLSKDSLSGSSLEPATQNPYPYALNNPVAFTDPSGRCLVCSVAGGAVGAAAGLVGTYAADVGGDIHNVNDVFNPNTYVPDYSWKTYAENKITGGVVGATCSAGFIASGFACYTIGTGVACATTQFIFEGSVDAVACAGQAALAGGAQRASNFCSQRRCPVDIQTWEVTLSSSANMRFDIIQRV
jgi:hypothetical protein